MMACSMAGTTTRVFAVILGVDDDAGNTAAADDDDDAIDGDIVKVGSASRTNNDCNTKSARNPVPIRCCCDDAPSAVGRGCGGIEEGGGNIKHPPAIITPKAELIPPT